MSKTNVVVSIRMTPEERTVLSRVQDEMKLVIPGVNLTLTQAAQHVLSLGIAEYARLKDAKKD